MTGGRVPGDRGPGDLEPVDRLPSHPERRARGPVCARTRGLIDRVIGEAVRPDDREHAATCAACGPVLARAATFDDALRRTARGLVAEELPHGILDPGLAGGPRVITRRAGPGLAGIVAAVAIMVVAMSVALLPGGLIGPSGRPSDVPSSPPPGQSGVVATPGQTSLAFLVPPLRSTASIGGSLIREGWDCRNPSLVDRSARPLESPATSRGADHEGIGCSSPPAKPISVTLITAETVDNEVIEVAIKGDLVVDTESSVSDMAATLSLVTGFSVGDKDLVPRITDWVQAKVPELKVQPSGARTVATFGRLQLTLDRNADGSYFLLIQPTRR